MAKIYLYGGSFNPPGIHHEQIVRALIEFKKPEDRLFIVPCGQRPDKVTTNFTLPIHRTHLIHKAFGHIPGIELDLRDFEKLPGEAFTTSSELIEIYEDQFPNDQIVLVVGQDLIKGGKYNGSDIHCWYRGDFLWHTASFLILTRGQQSIDPGDFPHNSEILQLDIPGSSDGIRTGISNGMNVRDLVSSDVYEYIWRHQLYTGRIPPNPTLFKLRGNALVIADQARPKTAQLMDVIARAYADRRGAPNDHIIVIGGDGAMLHAIQQHLHRRIPFLGFNAGTLGFLHNDGTEQELEQRLRRGELLLYQQPVLSAHAQTTSNNRPIATALAFNEIYLKAAGNQAVWLRVTVDGIERFSRLMGDGFMVSTVAGSSGWARSYGVCPLMIGTNNLLLTGVGTLANDRQWLTALANLHAVINIEVLDPKKRPAHLIADGRTIAKVTNVTIRTSSTQSVELGFFRETDLAEKISRLYYPV